MSQVSVKIGRDESGEKYVIEVAVYSNKPSMSGKLMAKAEVDPGQSRDSNALTQLIYTAGAACAEHLCEKYQENHDPSTCGAEAVKDFLREAALMKEMGQGFAAKLASLLARPLVPLERQRVERLAFLAKRGADPTREDNAWVNGILARHSRRRPA